MASNKFESLKFSDNVLNQLQTYSYHLTLTMINPLNIDMWMDDSGAVKSEEQVVIAQTGTTTLLSIDQLDVQAAMSFGAGARDALGVRGQFVIFEPVTFNFYKFLHLSAKDLDIKAGLTTAQYVLTIRFTTDAAGEQERDSGTMQAYSWPIKITSIDSSYGSAGEGSQHICNFVEVGFADLQSELKLKKGITIENCKTFGDAIKAIEKKLKEQEFDVIEADAPSRGVTDVYKITNHYGQKLQDSTWIYEKYERFTKGPRGPETVLQPTFTFNAGASISTVIKTLWQATTVNKEQIDHIKAQKAHKEETKKSVQAGLSGAMMRAQAKKKPKSRKLVYYTLNTNIKSTMFDETRNDYALFWDITIDPYTVVDNRNTSDKEDEPESIKSLEEQANQGHFNKFYRYQFTGLNTDVINLDLKFNVLYFIANPPYDGLLATAGGTTQAMSALSDEKKNKVGIKTSGDVTTITVVQRGEETGGPGAGKPAYQVLTVEPTARQYKNPKQDIPVKFAEEFTASKGTDEALRRKSRTHSTSKMSDESNKTSLTETSNYQLMNLENVTDLVNIELEIRGDPYWFGRPRKIPSAKLTSSKSVYPDYYKGAPYFLLDTRFGEEYDLADGLIHTNQLDIFAGVYQVVTVTSLFQNGVFTQHLKSVRQMSFKNNVISKLMLEADSQALEERQEEGAAAARAASGTTTGF